MEKEKIDRKNFSKLYSEVYFLEKFQGHRNFFNFLIYLHFSSIYITYWTIKYNQNKISKSFLFFPIIAGILSVEYLRELQFIFFRKNPDEGHLINLKNFYHDNGLYNHFYEKYEKFKIPQNKDEFFKTENFNNLGKSDNINQLICDLESIESRHEQIFKNIETNKKDYLVNIEKIEKLNKKKLFISQKILKLKKISEFPE